MINTYDTLSLLAEIAITIAGFSGIVIALGGHSLSAVSILEKRRLNNLFLLSGFVLCISLLAIALLHLGIADDSLLWRGGSAAIFLLATPWLIVDTLKIVNLDATEKAKINWPVFYVFDAVVIGALILQVVNVLLIRLDWPFILALVIATVGAFQQFILIVQTKLRDS